MMKKIIPLFLFFILLISFTSAVCTLDFDSDSYFKGQTVIAQMICDASNEKNNAYVVTWRDQNGIVVETDVGVTPSIVSNLFAESYMILLNSSTTNINATLTGTNLEGEDSASVTAPLPTTLLITDLISSTRTRLGELESVKFTLLSGVNKTVNNAKCSSTIFSQLGDVPIGHTTEEIVYDGVGHLEAFLDRTAFIEGTTYLSRISCMCINLTENRCFDEDLEPLGDRTTSSIAIVRVQRWLANVTTIVDKTSYVLSDKFVRVCVVLFNNDTERIPVDINYNFRCSEDMIDNSTDRVVVSEYREFRGIDGNTTQTQCVLLPINNIITIQNKVTTCYAATDVGVIFGELDKFPVTYHTISPDFNMTSDSSFDISEVEGMDLSLLGIIVLIPLFLAIILIIASATMNEDHYVLRIFFFLLSPVFTITAFHFATIGIVNFYGLTELQDTIGSTVYWITWLSIIILGYFVAYAIWKSADVIAEKKKAQLKY